MSMDSHEHEERPAVADSGGTSYSRHRRPLRRRLVRAGVVAGLLVILGSVYAALAPASHNAAASDNAAVNAGRALFIQGCAACHGLNGQGSDQGPSLVGVGPAAVDFQVGTGRMPLKIHGPEAERHRQEYTEKQIEDMAAYVGTFGPGPQIPSNALIDQYTNSDVAVGGALFRTNCAQCHNFSGSGGALTYGKYAPSLSEATPKQIYEAMLTGPENMPVFGDQEITPQQKLAIINYVRTLKTETDPGGVNLGRIGPVSEGLVAWVVGIGVLVLSVIWIGSRV
jgi:ubiquinol-cytochrome c reductase cytochrome c subunit